jgi:hypothetical protein
MPRKTSQQKQGTPRLRLSAAFLESLEKDFEAHRDEVIEALRKESPKAYAELLGRLVMTQDPPEGDALKGCNSMEDIGRRLLKSVGLPEPDEAAIQAAIEANDTFVARLQAIAQASGISPGTVN